MLGVLEVIAQPLAVGAHGPGRKQKCPFVCTAVSGNPKDTPETAKAGFGVFSPSPKWCCGGAI